MPDPVSLPHRFPEGFLWGAATSSYQIEGAVDADGRGPSIWDAFCRRPGKVSQGDIGDVACDHYNRLEEDLDLMKELGLKTYRFSIAWPRIQADGTGGANPKGIAFYDRLIDGLLARGIEPAATCYHWDLPLALEEKHGGWRSREIPARFEEYCGLVGKAFGDRVTSWFTINEPWVVWKCGHDWGVHAPGATEPEGKVSRNIAHHLLLAHGVGMRALRAAAPQPIRVGIAYNPMSFVPLDEERQTVDQLRQVWERENAWLFEPVYRGTYPAAQWEFLGDGVPDVKEGDLEVISQPTDFCGLNIYAAFDVVTAEGEMLKQEEFFPRTNMDWPITPPCLYWSPRFAAEVYGVKEVWITESGACFPDEVDTEGRVKDLARIEYLRSHLGQLHRAASEGFPVTRYYLWSLMDNFEWGFGYSKRFGLVHVNFQTLKRTPKLSARWYARVIANNGL